MPGQAQYSVTRVRRAQEALAEVAPRAAPQSAPASTPILNSRSGPARSCRRLPGFPFGKRATTSRRRQRWDGIVEASGQLKTVAISLHKIANDIRFLGCGPARRFGRNQRAGGAAGQQHHAGQSQPGDFGVGDPGRGPTLWATTRRVAAGRRRRIFRTEHHDAVGRVQPLAVGFAAGHFSVQFRRPVRGRNHGDGYPGRRW